MGFLDRAWKIATGLGGAAQSQFGYFKDLATAPFVDSEELDGFWSVVVGRAAHRFREQRVENLFGPDEGLGAAIGGLPERSIPGQPISGIRPGGRAAFEGLEIAGREAIREPIATAQTAGQLSMGEETPLGRVGAMFRGDTWSEAYDIAQDRSVGQAITLGLMNVDITDTAELNRAYGTDMFNVLSGTVDAVTRVTLDADIVLAKAGTAVRVAKFVKPITSAEKAAAAVFDAKVSQVLDDIHDNGLSSAQIRDRYFPKHDHGAPIADILARASEDRDELTLAFRGLVGDRQALGELADRRADLAGELSRLTGAQEAANRINRAGFDLTPRSLRDEIDGQILAEARFRHSEQLNYLDRLLGVQEDGVTIVPKTAGAVRDLSFANSHILQDSTAGVAVRRVGRMQPQPWVNFEDLASDVQLTRMLQRAPIDPDDADTIRSAYISQMNPHGRRQVFDQAVDRIVEAYGQRAGMTGDELVELVRSGRAARGASLEELSRSRSYDAAGRDVFEVVDDNGEIVRSAVPIWMTQESNFGIVPNLDVLDKASQRIARHTSRYDNLPDWVPGKGVTARTALGAEARAIPPELLEMFHRGWKASVLFRLGWPIRVGLDEQLRIAAKIGVLTQLGELGRAAGRWTVDAIDSVPDVMRGQKSWAEAKDRWGLRWYHVKGHRLRATRTPNQTEGLTINAARGNPIDGRNVHQAMVEKSSNLNARLFGAEAEYLTEMRKGVQDHRTFMPTEKDYGSRWAQALNKQAAGDAVGRKLLEGESVEDVVRWLRNDEAGQAYLKRDPLWKAAKADGMSLEDTIALKKGQLDDLTLGYDQVAAKALTGDATIDDLRKVEPDAGKWMPVHGQVVADAFGGSTWTKFRNEAVAKIYRALGGLPSVVLARNRFFDRMYKAEVERLLRLADESQLTDDGLRLMERQGKDYALDQVRRVLFDVSERSDLAETLRFISPFFMAQQEVVTRWAGLAAENPAFILAMHKVWTSPEKAGIVVDENGNRIDANGQATVPLTGEKVEAGEDRFVVLPIPEWAEDIPGAKALGRARFNKEALNVAMQLNSGIGTGPIVQVPVNELVKNRPQLAEAAKFILPYGTSQDALDLILPATLKRIRTRIEAESSEEYRNSVIRIYFDLVTDYELGKRDTKPTYPEAEERAKAFWSMRTIASWVSPAAPWFTSPYQAHIDAYRSAENKYREAEISGQDNLALADAQGNPRTPSEWFLDEFGEEYFALTQHVSRSVDGVPPTVGGFMARKEHQDLIESLNTPALGGLVVGADGAGDFSRAVYEHQRIAGLRPGSDRTQREGLSFEEARDAPAVRLGWSKFSKFMDVIDVEMSEQGLPNLQVKAAAPLAALKRAYIAKLADEHPEWYADYVNFDPLKQQRKIEDLRRIAADPTLSKRAEIQALGDYLELRDIIAAELAARQAAGGASTLTATANQDLRAMWETAITRMKDRPYGLAFSALHSRWLSNDLPTAADTTTEPEAAAA